MRVAWLMVMLLSSCGFDVAPARYEGDFITFEEARVSGLHKWAIAYGYHASDRCVSMVMQADIDEYPAEDVAMFCQLRIVGSAEGCMYSWDESAVAIAVDVKYAYAETIEHEIAHALEWCETGVVDVNHTAEWWSYYGTRGQTVEYAR